MKAPAMPLILVLSLFLPSSSRASDDDLIAKTQARTSISIHPDKETVQAFSTFLASFATEKGFQEQRHPVNDELQKDYDERNYFNHAYFANPKFYIVVENINHADCIVVEFHSPDSDRDKDRQLETDLDTELAIHFKNTGKIQPDSVCGAKGENIM